MKYIDLLDWLDWFWSRIKRTARRIILRLRMRDWRID